MVSFLVALRWGHCAGLIALTVSGGSPCVAPVWGRGGRFLHLVWMLFESLGSSWLMVVRGGEEVLDCLGTSGVVLGAQLTFEVVRSLGLGIEDTTSGV